ncbi:MT-A70 family methyltransferase [Methylosinus sp. Sm6]|uniref:MT-A70 family methyltransferase n=1 Tax=Methylosinus sp. Sm6 TaxID=2866948 RepID=UPI001C9958CF|nr:MT-A70 family methyltransferase [Methylosinus sp. Sm6]MBY6244144.1 DNA methyltransferase [Methylosinus sp. Sm6]
MSADWPFGGLQEASFGLILADPAWSYATRSDKGQGKSASRHYRTMTREELYALPVWRLAAPNCALCLWTTQAMLPMQLDLMLHWGFAYKSYGVWGKRSKTNAKWAFGTGHWERSAAEVYLWGAIGEPRIVSHSERNIIVAPLREHSRKPEDIYRKCKALFPGVRKLDLFSRQTRPGWSNWGDERTKFDGAEA